MPTANGARVSPARVAPPAMACAMLSIWWLLCPGVALLDERPPLRVWCSQRIRTAAIEPDVVLTAGVTASSNHLSAACVEDLNGFTLGAIGCGLGVDLELEAADLSGLLRGELELKLQPIEITSSANDESSSERVQLPLANAIESRLAINIDGTDTTVFWTRA